MNAITERDLWVDGLRLHYRDAGDGDPVLLLHGWPTSSFLWRNVMPSIAAGKRVIALDMPGFGRSDKPLDVSYSFRYFERVLDGFLAELGIGKLGLAVHDLGGPIGLYWASRNPARVDRLALLNTLVYPQMSWAVVAFVVASRLPGLRGLLSSPIGLRTTMRIGVHDGPVVVSTHGNLLVLLLNYLDAAIGYEFWQGLRIPDVYRVEIGKTPHIERLLLPAV